MPSCIEVTERGGAMHYCSRPAHHTGKHKCGQCGLEW